MSLLNIFKKNTDNKEKDNKNNDLYDKKIGNDNLVNTLQKHVDNSQNENTDVETSIRHGDGMGLNSKISS